MHSSLKGFYVKKIISILVILAVCIGLSSCRSSDSAISAISDNTDGTIISSDITTTETPSSEQSTVSVETPSSAVAPPPVAESSLVVDVESNESTLPIVDDGKIAVMSFNVLCNDELIRSEMVLEIINRYSPDILGVQEATGVWINIFSKNLSPKYAVVGISRDANLEGEYSAVIYNKEKFNLIQDKTYWLSDTPNTPSKFEQSNFNRIVTCAVLERRGDGKRFLAACTHLDNSTDEVRELQSEKLVEILGEFKDMPIFLAGDFNVTNKSKVYKNVTESFLQDSLSVAAKKTEGNTFSNRVIDFVFISRFGIQVNKYRVIQDQLNGISPSDHNPVLIETELT